LHPLLSRRVVDWVIEAATGSGVDSVVVVSSPAFADAFGEVEVAVQEVALGTGDAVRSARAALDGRADDVLVLSGDTPLITPELLGELLAAHRANGASATVLSFDLEDPGEYGRILRNPDGTFSAIVEAADASEEQLAVNEVNSSIYVFRASRLWPVLDQLEPKNAQGELYLTDSVGILATSGETVAVYKTSNAEDALGVNTRMELAEVASSLRDRINAAHMLAGVTIVDPRTTWIDPDVEIEPDAVVHPFTVLRGTSKVASGAEIGPHAVAIDATIGEGASVGPFCYLRAGTVLEAHAKAGTFVEIKNAVVGEGAKVPHLSYVGDAALGDETNFGAGSITANFPHEEGQAKGKTTIGKNVRVGVNTVFLAPVDVGDDAWTAAGSVIEEDVPSNALAIARARQVTKEGRGGKRDGGKRND
ncbi:MAG: bifunctional UDP-N-acetylglucosamine diphosphorylase/glucosamine-1-phosphate N-acetyltransferase GlmU, partial [Actinobacteria bacterium]|nr:bifunctional UDP-N-acetylglucosamine diphosphorylase/glucosamine-1-phosphate N-acetyltransferase GlmU [Actinomycetota bacterium]